MSTTDFSHCVTTPSLPVSSAYTASYLGFNGVNNQVIVCTANLSLSTSFGDPNVTEYPGGLQEPAVPVIVSVYFVVDGSTWSFQYDTYGNVTYIGLPLGGNIQYVWGTFALTNCSTTVTYPSRAVKQRTITDNNGHSYVWNYNYGTSVCSGSMTNTMTDPLGNDTVDVFNKLQGVNNGRNDVVSYFVTSTKNYQGSQSSGNVLKEEDFQYYNNNLAGDSNTANSFITQVTTTMNGSVKRVVRTPDSGGYGAGMPIFGVVKTLQEYDFNNNLVRETDTSYKWEGNSNYLNANMIDLPISVQVKNVSNQICAETDSDYDDPTLLTTYPGTTFNHLAPPNAVRGNPTSISRKLTNTACSITSTTPSVTSSTKWYDTGEVLSSTDPMGHMTAHTYDPAYFGAYPTQTCSPQTGTVTHCVSGAYDLGTGLLTSFTDANGQTSTFNYDNEGRMKSAIAPADLSGQKPETDFNYPDLVTFQRTKKQDSGNNIVDFTYFDGLGRTRQTQLNDPEGNDTTEPVYDGLSRVSSMPNPHRSVASSTDGSTTTYYDALGRVVQVAPQDGTLLPANTAVTQCQSNNVCTDYSAFPVVTVTDQTNKQRRSRTDALGRLVEVDEPGAGTNGPGTPGNGSISISGALSSSTTTGNKATGSVTVSGAVQSFFISVCNDTCIRERQTDPGGNVTITVNGHADTVPYNGGSTANSIANALISTINGDSAAFAWASGPSCADSTDCTISLQARTPGPNYSLSAQGLSSDEADGFSSFDATSASGPSLTGGVYPVTTYDSGTLSVKVTGSDGTNFTASASYNQSTNYTAALMTTALINAFDVSGSPVSASLSGTTGIVLTANKVGTVTDYTVTGSSTASFTASSTTLAGGTNPGGLYAPFVTTYSYDILGNLTGVNQAGDGSHAARVRSFSYDTLSRLLTSTNPESGTITYTYDSDGNMITKTDARGIIISYSPSDAPIDGLHRVLKKTYSNGDTPVTYTYDQGANANGRLSSEALGTITRSFSYDPLGRVVGQTDCLPSGCHTTSVPVTQSGEGYNLASELVSLNYPDGRNVTSSFSAAGRITGVNLAAFNGTAINLNYYTVPQTTSPATWGYMPTGTMTRDNYGNGLAETLGFNPRLQINAITDVNGATTLFSKSYGFYDASNHNNGNILTITDGLNSAKNQTFTYDQLNRLATAAESDNAFNITYSIDPWGNMKESGTSNFNQAVDATNRMSGWSYDAAGNLLRDNLGHVYTYDAECRIKTVDTTGATYTYGPGGERVRKDTATAGSTEYIYFGGAVIAELNPSSGAWTDYIIASGKRIAKDTSSNGTGAQYFQGDHLGSTRIMTDSSGTVISSCTFAPYGEQVSCSPDNASNHYRFTGKERDTAESGLDYFGARHYSSSMGRFMTPDWDEAPVTVPYAHFENPQTLNLYSYVYNNPATGLDIAGHAATMSPVAIHQLNNIMVGVGFDPIISLNTTGELGLGPNTLPHGGDPISKGSYTVTGYSEDGGTVYVSSTPQNRPFPPCSNLTASDLDYTSDGGKQHIEDRHMQFLKTGVLPSMGPSQYIFQTAIPGATLDDYFQLVETINAYTFENGTVSQSKGNHNFVFVAALLPQSVSPYLVRAFIGRPWDRDTQTYLSPTVINTLVVSPDCKTVQTSHVGEPWQ